MSRQAEIITDKGKALCVLRRVLRDVMNIKLTAKGGSYEIVLAQNCLLQAGSFALPFCRGGKALVVTDENVAPLYLKTVTESLARSGIQPFFEIVPPGEQSKSLETLAGLYASFARCGLTRDDLLLALGGGVVGDLCGFAAATYLRGVGFLQIPTTLLAQTDSSVGGKCGVNMPFGKNTVGAFYQPVCVLADPCVLDTLPAKEFSCGMAEVLKYACIMDLGLLEALKQETFDRMAVIAACITLKKELVQEDERDTGRRMLLNFGHTFGHAIEKLGDYKTYTHGEGVAMGMVMAARLGEALQLTPAGTAETIAGLCAQYGLPTHCPYPMRGLLPVMAGDKKRLGGKLHFVLLRELGCGILYEVAENDLESLLLHVFD